MLSYNPSVKLHYSASLRRTAPLTQGSLPLRRDRSTPKASTGPPALRMIFGNPKNRRFLASVKLPYLPFPFLRKIFLRPEGKGAAGAPFEKKASIVFFSVRLS